jgi:hypothetical protein
MPTVTVNYLRSRRDEQHINIDLYVPTPYSDVAAVNLIRQYIREGVPNEAQASSVLLSGRTYSCRNVNGTAVGRLSV